MKSSERYIVGAIVFSVVLLIALRRTDPKIQLRNKLLRVGGNRIENADQDVYDYLVKNGQFFTGTIDLFGGPEHKCFESSKEFVMENPEYQLCFGYSLVRDRYSWYYHAWVISPEGHILEMTDIFRDSYYGVILTEGQW